MEKSKRFLNFLLLLPIFFLAFLLQTGAEQAEKKASPNVLMISIDDLNDWVGVLGAHPNAQTPNIDRLANKGMLFTNAHCQAPICGPSRASIMSGLRPSTTGIYGQINDDKIRESNFILQDIAFLPQYFEKNGYKTLGVGKIFHKHAPEGVFQVSGGRIKGFGPRPEKRLKWDQKGTSTDWGAFPEQNSLMNDYSYAQWAKKELHKEQDGPFFMAVGFIRPHVPWHAPKSWFDKYPLDEIVLPEYIANDLDDLPEMARRVAFKGMMPTTDWAIESGEWSKIVQAYLACISFVDHQVGVVLDALDKSPHKDNTIVLLWSDHGYELGEKGSFGKHTLWSESTRVPLIVKLPQQQKNKSFGQAVELLDIYPTLLELAGLPKNLLNEGSSLVPLIEGDEDPNAVAITTYGRNNHSLINTTHRYIRYEDGSEELYDLQNDPGEHINLASSKKSDEIKVKLLCQVPELNAPWALGSFNDVNEYFQSSSQEK